MTDKINNIINSNALSGYFVCFADQCPLHDDCLRWKVGQHLPTDLKACTCVNPRFEKIMTEECPMYEPAHKQRFAKGMYYIFTDDMPVRVINFVRDALVAKYNRTYYFEYRSGKRLMPPAMQEEIRELFRRAGWTQEVKFDEYVEL